jgi:hypothetical protein
MFAKCLHSLATRVPRIVLQRAEEIFPSVKEIMVSVLCLYAQKRVLLPSPVLMAKETKYIMTIVC